MPIEIRVAAIEDLFDLDQIAELSSANRPAQAFMAALTAPIPNIFITRFML